MRTIVVFFAGMIFGIIVATIGFTVLAKMADTSVEKVQEVARDAVK